jgi:NAD(P)-dependent dehydrogenase (short-subunit alcohol dehydrogenase family)
MRKKTTAYKGSIVCTASNAGVYPFPVAPIYATSKHAVVGAVRSLARPLEPEGIQINALAPAVIGMPFHWLNSLDFWLTLNSYKFGTRSGPLF